MTLDIGVTGSMGSLRFSGRASRSVISDSVGAVRYPSPFFDLGSMYLPTSFKTMLRWCRYYFLTNPIINAVVYKMAEYPVTDLVFDTDNERLKELWEWMFRDVLQFKRFLVEVGLDYGCYGNAFISLHFPFDKYLICPKCRHTEKASKTPYTFRDYRFTGECKRCGDQVDYDVKDFYIRSPRKIRLIRWNPEQITINHNDATGESRYYYTVPPTLMNDIRMSKREVVENIPQIFIEATRQNKALLFSDNNLYHMKRPTIAQKDKGWGMPMILPVLKDTFYLTILRKAQEAISVEHAVPLRILFPQSGSATSDVYSTVNISSWKTKIEQEIMRWRCDNNYIPVLPLPVGQQTLGGDGRALMLAQEYRIWTEQIIAGMGVPQEFLFGGLSFCLDPDSYVQTDQGLVKIGSLAPISEGSRPSGAQTVTHLGTGKVSLAHNTGMRKAARITTRLGLEAMPSHDHRYLVLRDDLSTEWVRVADIIPGDFIAVRPGAELWPVDPPDLRDCREHADDLFYSMGRTPQEDCTLPEHMTDELARLIGYLVSEGSSSNGRRFSFGQRDEPVMQDFLDCVEKVFGYRPNSWHGGSGCYQTEIGRRRAYGFLEAVAMGDDSYSKVVPEIILRSPKRYVAQFLLGYFEGGGGASKVSKTVVSCCSVSEELTKQIQLLLLNMGIVSSRYNPYDEHNKWTLQIRSSHVRTYAREVGFVSERKKQNLINTGRNFHTGLDERVPYLKEALDGFKDRNVTSGRVWSFEPVAVDLTKEEYTPVEISDILGVDVTTVYYHIKKGRMEIHRILPGVQGRFPTRLVRRDSVKEFLEKFGRGVRRKTPGRSIDGLTYEKLSSSDLSFVRDREPELAKRIEFIAETRYVWNEVRTVELFDFEVPMVDLTVEGDHSYIADGLVGHNSGSNVSLRMLENHFLDQKSDHLHLGTGFVMPKVAAFMGWNTVKSHFKKFKMADDLQRSAFNLQLNQAGKISDRTLLEDTDWDAMSESVRISEENKRTLENQRQQALGQASIQGESQLALSKYQLKAQKAMAAAQADPRMMADQQQESEQIGPMLAGVPGQVSPSAMGQTQIDQMGQMNNAGMIPPMEEAEQSSPGQAPPDQGVQSPLSADQGMSVSLASLVNKMVGWLDQQPAHVQQQSLTELSSSNPQLFRVIKMALDSRRGAHVSSAGLPPPQVKAPMRGPESTT